MDLKNKSKTPIRFIEVTKAGDEYRSYKPAFSFENKRVGVTGGTGFIGTHLVKYLKSLGADVREFGHNCTNDLADIDRAFSFIEWNKPDVVFNLAAQSVVTGDGWESLVTNVDGTMNLLRVCHVFGVQNIVHVSTDKVYGNNDHARTDSPLAGVNHPYSASKLCGDVIAQMYKDYYGLPIRIVRTGNIYGPGDRHLDRIVPETITSALRSDPIILRSDGSFVRDYIYVGDVVPAYVRLLDEKPGVYNFGGTPWRALDIVHRVLQLMGREDLAPVIANTQKNEIPCQHVEDCPEWWQPTTSLDDGLKATIEWYSDQV